jgi:hypothetical protein
VGFLFFALLLLLRLVYIAIMIVNKKIVNKKKQKLFRLSKNIIHFFFVERGVQILVYKNFFNEIFVRWGESFAVNDDWLLIFQRKSD